MILPFLNESIRFKEWAMGKFFWYLCFIHSKYAIIIIIAVKITIALIAFFVIIYGQNKKIRRIEKIIKQLKKERKDM